MIDYSVYVMKF